MSRIATYVFLDLEATGIPKEEHNKTKITELSLIAVKRQHLLECKPGDEPRVQQKVTLCVNPLRMVHPGATEASGLCNFLLERETSFTSKLCSMLQTFLELLTKPVCLVAQNGFNFDYPLLKNHLQGLSLNFADDLLCADSLHAFHDILELNSKTQQLPQPQPEVSSCERTESIESEVASVDELDFTTDAKHVNFQYTNERTPRKQIISVNNPLSHHKNHLAYVRSHAKVKRKLFWGDSEKPKGSYTLKDIYERLLNAEAVGCHRAEMDCIMVMKCAVVVSEQFVSWVDRNHCLFSDVKPMRIGVPIGD